MKHNSLSPRLKAIVDALPLKPDIPILEIGCGTGAAARAIAQQIGNGYILGIDRSERAIQQAIALSQDEIAAGSLGFRQIAAEDFELESGEQPYDLASAIRVGALDGRHPEIAQITLFRIAKALTRKGRLYIDGGNPLQEIKLDAYR